MLEHELPAGHTVHVASPNNEYFPVAQSPEIVLVPSLHDCPAGHATHTMAPPAVGVYRLAAHAAGAAETELHEDPAGQVVHPASPSRLYSPAAHCARVIC